MVSIPAEFTAESIKCPVCGNDGAYRLRDRLGYNDVFICSNLDCEWFVDATDTVWADAQDRGGRFLRTLAPVVNCSAEKVVCPSCGEEPSYIIKDKSRVSVPLSVHGHDTIICLNPKCKWYLSALDDTWDEALAIAKKR